MSLNTASTELSSALKTLREQWERVRESWQDSVAEEFRAEHWEVLETQVVATLRAMERLGPILSRARRECS
jgi:uncharacterized protein YukE